MPMTAKMTVYLDMVSIHGETSRREITNVVHFNEGRKIIQVTSAEDPNNRSSRYTVYGFDMSTILGYEIDCIPDAEGAPTPDNDGRGTENSDIPMPIDPMDLLVKDEEDEYGEEN